MPVARGIGCGAGADNTARAREIFDEEVLAEALGKVLRNEAWLRPLLAPKSRPLPA